MLSKSISTSLKVSKLTEFAQLLFTWMIPHTDDFGRIDGEPEVVRALVMPFSKRKAEDFSKALFQIAELGLISWYRTNGKVVIEIINSDNHQSNIINKRTNSHFPEFEESSENFLEILGSSKNFVSNLTKLNLTKPNLTKPNPTVLGHELMGEFEIFWKSYPKRKNRGQAEKAWLKLKPNEQLQSQILAAIERAKTSESWAKDGGRYIPYPATWLNAKGWEDEISDPPPSGIDEWLAKEEAKEAANGSG